MRGMPVMPVMFVMFVMVLPLADPEPSEELLRGLAEQAGEHEGEEGGQGEVTGEVTGLGVAAMAVHIGSE